MIKDYDGPLGKFQYDNKEFILNRVQGTEILEYVGDSSEGKDIKIPKGIISCEYMFYYNHNIVSMPKIPYGVTNCRNMFNNCTLLRELTDLPDSVKTTYAMFANCTALETVQIHLSNCLEYSQDMFAHCTNLKKVKLKLPDSLISASGMFQYCLCLESTVAYYPKNTNSFQSMYSQCTNLKVIILPPKDLSWPIFRNMFTLYDSDTVDYIYRQEKQYPFEYNNLIFRALGIGDKVVKSAKNLATISNINTLRPSVERYFAEFINAKK